MSKEAKQYIKDNHPDPDSLLTGNPKRDDFIIKNITSLMQSYANQEVKKALYKFYNETECEGLHATDFMGKCFKCGKQIFTKESKQ